MRNMEVLFAIPGQLFGIYRGASLSSRSGEKVGEFEKVLNKIGDWRLYLVGGKFIDRRN